MKYILTLALILLVSGCGQKDNGKVTGGNTMETENAISARLQYSDGSPAVGAIAKLCNVETPQCASGPLAIDTADSNGNVGFPLQVAGNYLIVVDLQDSLHLEIPAIVPEGGKPVNLGAQTVSTVTQILGSSSSSASAILPDSAEVAINPTPITEPAPTASAPTVSNGISKAFGTRGFIYPTALYAEGNGALLVSLAAINSWNYTKALTLAKITEDGDVSGMVAYENLAVFGKYTVYAFNNLASLRLPSGDIVIACGAWVSPSLQYQYWIAQFSSSFELKWAKLINNQKWDHNLTDIHTDIEGNLYVTGQRATSMTDSLAPFLAKFTAQGELQWIKDYAQLQNGQSTRIWKSIGLDDGSTIMAVNTSNTKTLLQNIRLRKVDANGAQVWEKETGIQGSEVVLAYQPSTKEIMLSTSNTAREHYSIDGTLANKLPVTGSKLNPESVMTTVSDGGLLIVGVILQGTPGNYWTQALMERLDANGKSIWTDLVGNSTDYTHYMQSVKLSNGRILLAGSISPANDSSDLLFIRIRDDAL